MNAVSTRDRTTRRTTWQTRSASEVFLKSRSIRYSVTGWLTKQSLTLDQLLGLDLFPLGPVPPSLPTHSSATPWTTSDHAAERTSDQFC